MKKFICRAPEGDTGKAYKVWNGKSYSYLAKSQMHDVTISGDVMTFYTSDWYAGFHKDWLRLADNTSSTLDV